MITFSVGLVKPSYWSYPAFGCKKERDLDVVSCATFLVIRLFVVCTIPLVSLLLGDLLFYCIEFSMGLESELSFAVERLPLIFAPPSPC